MARSRAVLFDFDGTIADSVAAVQRATNAVLRRRGLSEVSTGEIIEGMRYDTQARMRAHMEGGTGSGPAAGTGAGVDGSSRAAGDRSTEQQGQAGEVSAEEVSAAAREYHRELLEGCSAYCEYDGMLRVLRRCREQGDAVGIVSNNTGELIRAVLGRWGARQLVDVVLGEEEVREPKPSGEGILQALAAISVPPWRAAYVGDSGGDAEAARAAGVYAVGVLWTAARWDTPPPEGFPRAVESADELGELLGQWREMIRELPLGGGAGDPHVPLEGGRAAAPWKRPPVQKTLYFMRHCESAANRDGILSSRNDYELSERGRDHAARLGPVLAEAHPVERIYASPLRRAWETGEPVAQALGIDIEPAPALVEHHLGIFSGLSYDKVEERGDYEHDRSQRWDWTPEGGESYRDIYKRVVPFLVRTLLADPAERILCVTHAVTMRLIYAFMRNSAPDYPAVIPHNGEVWRVSFRVPGVVHEVERLELIPGHGEARRP